MTLFFLFCKVFLLLLLRSIAIFGKTKNENERKLELSRRRQMQIVCRQRTTRNSITDNLHHEFEFAMSSLFLVSRSAMSRQCLDGKSKLNFPTAHNVCTIEILIRISVDWRSWTDCYAQSLVASSLRAWIYCTVERAQHHENADSPGQNEL